MKDLKRLPALLLALVMVLGMLPTAAFAAEGETPVCTCDAEGDTHAEGCPLYVEPESDNEDDEGEEDYGISALADDEVEALADEDKWAAAEITISTLEELKKFASLVNGGNDFKGKTITLGADIDLENNEWTPIGSPANSFLGTFDGGDNTVSNLTVNGEGRDYQGFFGYISTPAAVKNLTVENAQVTGRKCVGTLIGDAYTGVVENCHVTGKIEITGNYDVGGLTGYGYARLTDCSVVGAAGSTVTGIYVGNDLEGDNVGGLIGYFAEGSAAMTDCSAENLTVTGTRKVGGLVGSTHANRSLINCSVENVTVGTNATADYANGNKKTMGVGGLIGLFNGSSGGKLENCSVENVTMTNKNDVFAKIGYVSGGGRTGEEVTAPDMTVTNVAISGVNTGSNITVHDPALSGNAVETANTVAQVGGQYFESLPAAIDAAQDGDTVVLLKDVSVNETYSSNASLEIRKALTIDGQGQFTITCEKKFGIRIFGGSEDAETMKVVLKDVTVTNANSAGRAVETRGGNVELELDNATLTTTGTGNTQVFTVGGNRANTTTVTIQNGSKLIASQAGYGILTFNPVNMTIDASEVSGYGALYFKGKDSSAGSAGSTVNIVNGAKVSSAGIAGSSNTFGTLVFQDENITVHVEDATVEATADPSNDPATPQAVILFSSWAVSTAGVVVNISGSSYVNTVNESAAFVCNNTDQHTIAVSGGTFSCDVSDYCAEGFLPVRNADGTYGVTEGDLTITANRTSLSGSGTVTLTVTPANVDEVTVTCDVEGITVTPGAGNAWTVRLPNTTATYTFTAEMPGNVTPATCTVRVTRYTAPVYVPPVATTPVEEEEEDLEDTEPPLAAMEDIDLSLKNRPFVFTDVAEKDWFYTAALYAWNNGMMNGLTDTLFGPNNKFTRGMVATILYRMEGKPETAPSGFTDVERDKWYTAGVDWAAANGIVKGYPGGRFHPEDAVTRQEMAVILGRYAVLKGVKNDDTQGDVDAFADVALIADWARNDMAWAVGAEIMRGGANACLYPDHFSSRAEAAQMLMNFCEKLMKSGEEQSEIDE